MKILLMALSLTLIAFGCNKKAGTEFQQEKQEANKEYRENVNEAEQKRQEEINEAKKQRSEDIEGAREDLREGQKEEAKDYIDESDAARVNRGEQKVEVQDSKDQ
jgi:hypothetical protein